MRVTVAFRESTPARTILIDADWRCEEVPGTGQWTGFTFFLVKGPGA